MKENKEETYLQRKRRLFGRFHHMKTYIEELNRILKVKKTAEDIWSIVDSDNFVEESKKQRWALKYVRTIPFEEKQKLLYLLESNVITWNQPHMLYISNARDCGFVTISSLDDFNWNFNFYDESGGIVCFEDLNHTEKITLDYDEESSEYLIELKIYQSIEK